jgi:hypothetical protein
VLGGEPDQVADRKDAAVDAAALSPALLVPHLQPLRQEALRRTGSGFWHVLAGQASRSKGC